MKGRQLGSKLSLNHKDTFTNITPRDFSGGAVDKNLPAKAGDMGLIPGPGRSHRFRATKSMYHNY